MTNKEQAAILSGRALGLRDGATKEKFDIAMKMAQWKEQQFKEYLEKKCGEYTSGELVYAVSFINSIINELFGETKEDNLDMEDKDD